MEGKLIKMVKGYTLSLTDSIDDLYGISNKQLAEDHLLHKLSLKNCQTIEMGYDLDELAESEYPLCRFENQNGDLEDFNEENRCAFKEGFKKAIELLHDKKFTEEDMIEASKYGYDFRSTTSFPEQEFEDSCIRNTQQWLRYKQIEWDVVVEMIGTEGDGDYKPKLDEDGCLILKRK